MKKIGLLVLSAFCVTNLFATDYYVDAMSGNDANSGTSPEKAWKSLSGSTTNAPFKFNSGDKLFIKAGTVYQNQQLVIAECRATPDKPFVITSYGEGAKPIINLGTFTGIQDGLRTTLYLKNSTGVEISNLEIQNYVGKTTATSTAQKYGAYIYANNIGEAKHIKIDGVDFKHVKGSNAKGDEKAGAGIYWYCEGATPTYFNGLEIANCEFYNVDRIAITGNNAAGRATGWYNNINVHLHRNYIHNIGGQGITIKACDGAVCEYNRVDSCGVRERGVAIWSYKADNSVIQYNIVSNAMGATDAQGFDSDYNCTNTIFQYNMSVHNEGGFMLVCSPGDSSPKDDETATWNAGLKGTTIRYNLSIDDGYRTRPGTSKAYFSPVFHITGDTRWTEIYGNTLIMLPKKDGQMDRNFVTFMNWGNKKPGNTYFYNNIFYAADGVTGMFDKHAQGGYIKTSKYTEFSSNVYAGTFSSLPSSVGDMFPNGIEINDENILKYDAAAKKLELSAPLFVNPSELIDFSITGLNYEQALAKAKAFCLVSESEAAKGGKRNFLTDFFNGIEGIQIDYYAHTGFTGYKPLPTKDYLSNNFGLMGGQQYDFFGNIVDDQKETSIGFHNVAAATGLNAITLKQLTIYPTYATDHVVIPFLEGEAYVVTSDGRLVTVLTGKGEEVVYDVSALTNGMYFIRTNLGTGKFIKE